MTHSLPVNAVADGASQEGKCQPLPAAEPDTPDTTDSHVVPVELDISIDSEGYVANGGRLSDGSFASSTGSMQELSYGRYDELNQVLRLEFISDDEARRCLFMLKFAASSAIIATIILVVLKTSGSAGDFFVMSKAFHVSNVVLGALLLLVALPYTLFWAHRIHISLRTGKAWSTRRRVATTTNAVRAAANILILLLFVAENAAVLVDPGLWCNGNTVQYMAFFTWTGWNVLFCVLMFDAHGLVAVDEKKDRIVRDEPLSQHWRKLIMWWVIEGTLIWTAILSVDGSVVNIKHVDGADTCEWGDDLECSPRKAIVIASSLTLAGFVAYWLRAVWHVFVAWRQTHHKLYLDYKIAHTLLRLQVRFMIGFTLIIVSAVLLWLVGPDPCANYALSWFGMLPMMILMTSYQWVGMFLTLPRHPDAPPPKMNALYQQFAWTEASKPRQIERRNKAFMCNCGHKEPMFCVETTIKLFYWSVLIYDFTEAEGHTFSMLPSSIREILGEVNAAMDFYKLVKRRLFYDRARETKVLCAWNYNTILVSIRGSAAASNFVADAQFVQTPHPPVRKYGGRTPRVHGGFLKTWQAASINEIVVNHIAALLDSAEEERGKVQVLLTGHSLGGAVAILAAYDIVTKCKLSPEQVTVYTFGAPRVGNRAFARDYGQTVPDTWNVINDQDLVTRGMKLYGLYKRAGHRVIINSVGDLIVRPSIFEASLMQMPFRSSAAHHLTPAYQDALHALLSNQIKKGKRHREGLAGVKELLEAAPIVTEVAQKYAQNKGVANFAEQVGTVSLRSISLAAGSQHDASMQALARSRSHEVAIAAALADTPLEVDEHGEIAYEPVYDGPLEGPSICPAMDANEMEEEEIPVGDGVCAEELPQITTDTPSCSSSDAGAPAAAPPPLPADPQKAAGRRLWAAMRQSLLTKRLSRADSAQSNIAELVTVTVEPSTPGGTESSQACRPARQRRCYIIPEEDFFESGNQQAAEVQTEGGNTINPRTPKRCTVWHCPLTAAPENLPANAKLTDTGIVEIGALPNMKACRLFKRGGTTTAPANALISMDTCPVEY